MKMPTSRPRGLAIYWPYRRRSERVGWLGRLYVWVDRLGPVTRSSPLRRAVQLGALVLFLHAFFVVCWPYAATFSETLIRDKEVYPVELFLLLDPLSGLSTALAGRCLNWATLAWTGAILVLCLLVPRSFCGYLCPLGTCIDGFDWLVGRHQKRWQLGAGSGFGSWIHLKYYLLVSTLVASACGVLLSGFLAAIPVFTRGLMFTLGRAQLALFKGPHQLLPVGASYWVSVWLFCGVFALSLLGRRFWCRYVCPTGALLSVFACFRLAERHVGDSCTGCQKCVEICPFDAIRSDFQTRVHDCTCCQTCGGVCPAAAISFVPRRRGQDIQSAPVASGRRPPASRRSFLAVAVATGAAACALTVRGKAATGSARPVRPPGSVPEPQFLDLCVRCGQCFKVCPGPVLAAAGLEYGWESLWTPVAVLNHAGCHQECNFCTQVCPTGAIRPLDIATKRRTPMGLAHIDTATCLPFRTPNRRTCDLCHVECRQAGYDAIELHEIRIELDPLPPEGMFSELELQEMARIRVPWIDTAKCIGCGICQYRCHTTYGVQQQELKHSAIVVTTGV